MANKYLDYSGLQRYDALLHKDLRKCITKTSSDTSVSINPNVYYSFPTMGSLTIMLATPSSDIVNEYHFEFNSGSTATSLSLPNMVKGIDSSSIEANKHYEISIKYSPADTSYYGLIYEWSLS